MNFSWSKTLISNPKVLQVSSLYTSAGLGIIVGIAVSIVNTRFLGPQQYGDFKFLQTLFSFSIVFFTMGLFFSGGRLLALNKNEGIKNELTGSLVVIASIISIIFSLALFCFSFYEEDLFQNELGRLIRIFSPLLFVYPFQLCLENILQGDNRIFELSIFRLNPKVLYLIGAILFNWLVPLKLSSALAIQFATIGISICLIIFLLKPNFINIHRNFKLLWRENKSYGFLVYVGSLANVASDHFAGLSVGYFVDNVNVGLYSLALTITTPLTMIPSLVGTTLFKEFANRNKIPFKATIATSVLSLCALIIFFILIGRIVLILYSEDFKDVIRLSMIISIGCILHGFGDYINRFLGAHGQGLQLRNGALVVGVFNIIGYFVFAYSFGVKGAAFIKSASGVLYFSMMYLYYDKFARNQ